MLNLERKIFKTELNGSPISLEISKLAGKANAAVLGKYGDTAVLATIVISPSEKNLDYFPLTVDYEERFYAAGKIIGSRFIRREGRPSDEAILSSRLIDRTIRPLFDERLRYEVQVSITVFAYDEEHDPDVIALLATSTALGISEIPWDGPVAGVKTIIPSDYPTTAFFAGTEDVINMIEFEGKEVEEQKIYELFESSQQQIKKLIEFQKPIIKQFSKTKIEIKQVPISLDLQQEINKLLTEQNIADAVFNKKINEFKQNFFTTLQQKNSSEEELKEANNIFENKINEFIHKQILNLNQRPDGRKLDQIRDLYTEIHLFNRTHGSALFVRGETQILAITTLASPSAEQLVETMETNTHKRFMLHYNFPGFSSGETNKSRGGPGRREIGHGALAAKALNSLIPPKEQFPYTIRIVAETLSSNGSTSMASVCAGSLSLMDAGVPIPKHCAGISIGLITNNGDLSNFKLITDIQGPEDHYGDMDFKVAGTEQGVNAIQMDVKIKGINLEIFKQALSQAKKARLEILNVLNQTINKPREQISPFAPIIKTIIIPKEKIGELIGPGGKNINNIIEESLNQITIDIEQDGTVYIIGNNIDLINKAYNTIKNLIREYKVGEMVEGTIIKILDFGAIVDLGSGKDGMIHISELQNGYVKRVEDVVKLGEKVRAKIIRIEPDGRIALSIKNK
ncbi:MAG: polyribonucleotide nucleotidyltransferase [Minisyncoccia bacterium]